MRPRKKDRHLPKYVHHRHGAYYLVIKGKYELLGHDLTTALAEYSQRFAPAADGMSGLIDQALAAMRPRLAKTTWHQYQIAANKLKHMLGHFTPQQLLPRHVAQLKIKLADTPSMCNRCLSVLRLVFDYAVENQLVDSNPAASIKRYHEQKRRRLISMDEFKKLHAKAVPRLQVIMDLLYLTGQRVNDVLAIKRSDLLEEGIYFEQDKTEARLIVGWSPELRAVVARAQALAGKVQGFTLLQGRHGKPVDYKTTYEQWVKLCKEEGVEDADLRDIRAMSATAIMAQGGDATALLGHTSKAMTQRYLRDKTVPKVVGPNYGQVMDITKKGQRNQ